VTRRRAWASLRGPAGLGVLVLTAALLFVASQRDPGYVRLSVAATSDGGTRHAARTFVVEAAPFSQVELLVNGHRITSAYVPGNARGVRFEDTPLNPGRNDVAARATLWYAAVRRVHDAAVVVDGVASSSRTLRQAQGDIGEGRGHIGGGTGARQLTLNVRFQEAAAAFTVMLARNDPAAVALRSGRMETAAFVDEIFGEPQFNHAPLSRFFSGVPARFRTSGDRVAISAESGYRHPGLEQLPAFSGALEIANEDTGARASVVGARGASAAPAGDAPQRVRDSRVWAKDVLRLVVADYRVDEPMPAPSLQDGAVFAWDRPFRHGQRPVAVALTYTPFASVTALRRGLNLSVFAFVHPIVARFLAIGHGLLLAIPMFAYLVLSKNRTAPLALIARRLIVVAVAADVFNACISSQPDVNVEVPLIAPVLRGLTAPVLTELVVPVLVGLVLAAIAASVAHLIERAETRAGVVATEAARAVSIAAAAYAAVVVVGYGAGWFASAPVLYIVLVGALLAAGMVALLRAVGWWTIPRARERRAFTVATVVCALVVAVPFSLVHYGAWAANPALTATGFASATSPLALTTEFLRTLALLSPFAFGLFLLRDVRVHDGALGIDAEQFARIALCCYAVDISGVVVLVPVSFILAWATFGSIRRAVLPGNAPATPMDPAGAGRSALAIAFVFAAIEVALFAWFAAPHLGELHTPFVALEAVVFVAIAVVSFVIPAVALGAWLRPDGDVSAMRRAVLIGAWVIACSLPAWFLRLETDGSLVAMVAVTAAFYLALGFFYGAPAVRRNDVQEAGAS
jgi:hypothetical protein